MPLDPEVVRSNRNRCDRCLQPAPDSALKCPNCGKPLSPATRYTTWLIGIAGLLALVFVIFLMVKAIENSDIQNAPPAGMLLSTSTGTAGK